MIKYYTLRTSMFLKIAIAVFIGSTFPSNTCIAQKDSVRKLESGYGRINNSVNGVSIFAGMFEEHGATVASARRLSTSIDEFDTIVWFPNSFTPPSIEAITRLQQWTYGGSNRRLIIVGRDYEATIPYLKETEKSLTGVERDIASRKIADIEKRRDTGSGMESPAFRQADPDRKCDWFGHKRYPQKTATIVTGPWGNDVVGKKSQIEYRELLTSKPVKLKHNTKLKVDGREFAYSIVSDSYMAEDNIYIISNGSFLLNYGLVNNENRKIATNVVEECFNEKVLFVESGVWGISVSETNSPTPGSQNSWGWISEPPLRYIVPHFLLWGMFFCFVFFPIFGRAKRVKRRSTSNFRKHISATAALLKKVASPSEARRQIEQYQTIDAEKKNTKAIGLTDNTSQT